MKIVKSILIATTILFYGCSTERPTESVKLNLLYDEIWDHQMISFPTYATYVGYPGQNGRWSDPSLQFLEGYELSRKNFLTRLQNIDQSELTDREVLGLKLITQNLQIQTEGFKFPEEFILIHQRSGVQQDISNVLSIMPKNSLKDFEDRLERLRKVPEYIGKTIDVLRIGLEKNITPPKITLRDVPPVSYTHLRAHET